MTTADPAGTSPDLEREAPGATGGASYCGGYPNGISAAHALAQGGEGGLAGPRARAHGDQPDLRHQGAPQQGGEADDDSPSASDAVLPARRPRRRAYQPSHREDVIAVRFTADEKAEIIAAAARKHVYPSGFLATAGLAVARGSTTALDTNDQLDAAIDELAALRAQISRVGNNINQIAYVYNSGGQPRPGQLDYALKALIRTLAQVDAAAHDLVRKRT